MKNYYVMWEANGNSTNGKLGPYKSKKQAIADGRRVVVGNQFVGGSSGGFSVELHQGDERTVVFAETVTIRDNGNLILKRCHDAEGTRIF